MKIYLVDCNRILKRGENDIYYVISDVHGEIELLEKALSEWKKDQEELIILGDFINRGKNSFECIVKMMELKNGGATVLMGNHEKMFLDWLHTGFAKNDMYEQLFENTLKEFYSDENDPTKRNNKREMLDSFLRTFPDIVEFLTGLDLYREEENVFFVHAGVDTSLDDYAKTSRKRLLNTRQEFILDKKKLYKIVVFGHTPSRFIHKDGTDGVWISEDGRKIGIDGAASYGGRLNAVRFNYEGKVLETVYFEK